LGQKNALRRSDEGLPFDLSHYGAHRSLAGWLYHLSDKVGGIENLRAVGDALGVQDDWLEGGELLERG